MSIVGLGLGAFQKSHNHICGYVLFINFPLAHTPFTTALRLGGWVQLNLLHLEQGRTVNELITAAINDYLEKHGNSPVA